MFSLINHTTLRCFHDKPDVVDKAAYVLPYAAWVDMAVGVILCIIGALALHGVIPMAGAPWMIAAGTVQILIGIIVKCLPCCQTAYRAFRSGGLDQLGAIFSGPERD